MHVIVSDCLRGIPCRYDGGARPCEAVVRLCGHVEPVGVCPETAAGLPVPRPPAEQRRGRVLLSDGTDVTREFHDGARRSLNAARLPDGTLPPLAVLKARSPSCGSGLVYDGTYTGTLVPGNGVFCRMLQEEGVTVVDEEMVERCVPSFEHPIAIVLGSGLGGAAGLVKVVRRIDYRDIPGFPEDAEPIPGHSFEAMVGSIDDVPVVVYPGRVHLYQGFTPREVTSLVRHAHGLGCRVIVFACATGAIEPNAQMGLGVISDHINLTGMNPLADTECLRGLDTPFVGMGDAYSGYLRAIAHGVADERDIQLGEGVYAGLLGPSFETPAEIRALGLLGCSYAGMSLVQEAIMARALGMEVLGLTLATNMAGASGVTHEAVLRESLGQTEDFCNLLRGILVTL
ncbi:MAG: purine-nucleoside phosphorylase [Atopobiaceae bacterium]|nr:purine-nucleoside phosphorylase [Atopobiaceae bacterium]